MPVGKTTQVTIFFFFLFILFFFSFFPVFLFSFFFFFTTVTEATWYPSSWVCIGNRYIEFILLIQVVDIRIKTVLKQSTISDHCEQPCSELNNPHHISMPQTTHLDCVFFHSIQVQNRVILNICAFLSLTTVVIHAGPLPQVAVASIVAIGGIVPPYMTISPVF